MSVSIYVQRTRLKSHSNTLWDCNGGYYHSGLATTIHFFMENDPTKGLLVHSQDAQHAILFCATWGFHHGVNEICALSRLYAALNGGFLPVFREGLSVPSSRVKQFFLDCLSREHGTEGWPEMSMINYDSTMRRSQYNYISLNSKSYFQTPCIRGGNPPLQSVFVNIRCPRKTWSSAVDLWCNIDCFNCVFYFRRILCAVEAGFTCGLDHQQRNCFSQICVNILVSK